MFFDYEDENCTKRLAIVMRLSLKISNSEKKYFKKRKWLPMLFYYFIFFLWYFPRNWNLLVQILSTSALILNVLSKLFTYFDKVCLWADIQRGNFAELNYPTLKVRWFMRAYCQPFLSFQIQYLSSGITLRISCGKPKSLTIFSINFYKVLFLFFVLEGVGTFQEYSKNLISIRLLHPKKRIVDLPNLKAPFGLK